MSTALAVAGPDAFLATQASDQRGTRIKFDGKEGNWKLGTGEELTPAQLDASYAVVHEAILLGWIKFNGPGEQPISHLGPAWGGYLPPPRAQLGDLDQAMWEKNPYNNQPADPWCDQRVVPLQNIETGELYFFTTINVSGRRAADALFRQIRGEQKAAMKRGEQEDYYILVKLGKSSYEDKKRRTKVPIPTFSLVGRVVKGDTSIKPEQLAQNEFDDQIPF